MVADNLNASFRPAPRWGFWAATGGEIDPAENDRGHRLADPGRVVSDGTISWPVGFAGSFHGEPTGRRMCALSPASMASIPTTGGLRRRFRRAWRALPPAVLKLLSGMRSPAMGTSMGIHFDTYLVDE